MPEVPFVFTINYTPAVAQIGLKGKSHVTESKDELKQIRNTYKEKKASTADHRSIYIQRRVPRIGNYLQNLKHPTAIPSEPTYRG